MDNCWGDYTRSCACSLLYAACVVVSEKLGLCSTCHRAMMYFGKHRNKKMDAIFRALSDPTRREILRLLQTGDLAAGELSDHFPVAKSTFSGHLKVLKEAGLVVTERQGTTIVYSLNTGAHEDVLQVLFNLMHVGEQRLALGEVRDAELAN